MIEVRRIYDTRARGKSLTIGVPINRRDETQGKSATRKETIACRRVFFRVFVHIRFIC
jgi:hypothetical protein